MTKLLQTTIAGSLPKPAWLAEPKTLWAPWRLEGDVARRGHATTPSGWCCATRSRRGIDIVTDGEQTRRHFVTTFLEALDGVDFEHRKTVRIRNRYDADRADGRRAGRPPRSGVRRGRHGSCARRRNARSRSRCPAR